MRSLFPFMILFLLITFSCKEQSQQTHEEHFRVEKEIHSTHSEAGEVLYSMLLPTDITTVFNRTGTNYDPTIPAPVKDITLYNEQEQIAVMLGIYGVDITYMKILEQTLPAAQYYRAIETLSGKAGIPQKIFEESARQLEKHFNNEDSLASVIDDIYRKTDRFFRESGKENLAALSLAGGWVEAMYIGTRIFESDSGNHLMAEQLLQQKFSLNSIYTLLSNHQESLAVKEYLLMLKKIRKVYDQVEIMYQKEGFSVDTTRKKIQSYSARIRYDEKTLNELLRVIPLVRDELITVKTDKPSA